MTNKEISLRTKRKLSAALKKRMRHNHLSKISISDIIKDCDVNRNTFYYHFHDINDLLKWTLEQEALNVVKDMDILAQPEAAIRFILDYIDKNKFILRCACDSLSREHFKQCFYADIKAIIDADLNMLEKNSKLPMSRNEMELFSMFFTEGSVGLMLDYAQDSNVWSKEEIVKIMLHLLTRVRIFIEE